MEERVGLVLFRGHEAHCLRCIEGPRALRVASVRLGGRLPLHCTASGKLLLASLPPAQVRALLAQVRLSRRTAHTTTDAHDLLAQLEAVRAQDYALDDQELEDGLMCIAAPIRDHSGLAVVALSVSGHRSRVAGELRTVVTARVRSAAAEISRALGARPHGAAASGAAASD